MSGPLPTSLPSSGPGDAPAVLCRGLVKRFGRTVALAGADLAVPRGSLFGLLGPNGAGKSTLVKIITGLVFPDGGEVRVLGGNPEDRTVRSRMGYLPEHFRFPGWLTGREVLDLHGRLLGLPEEARRDNEGLLRLTGIAGAGDRAVAGYSKGMQQRLGLAQALLGSPDLVLLDEPTSALDPLGRREVREVLLTMRAAGVTVFLNSHLLTEVEQVCDRVAIIRAGRVVAQGTTDELLAGTRVHLRTGEIPAVGRQRFAEHMAEAGHALEPGERGFTVTVSGEGEVPAVVEAAVAAGVPLYEVRSERRSLEDLFVQLMGDESSETEEPAGRPVGGNRG